MATKTSTPSDEKFQSQDFDLFKALQELDKKNYFYLDSLTEEQQKKFVPYMLTHWMSQVKSVEGVARYYVMSTNEYANKHLFNEFVQKHPKLQWMMLCASSPSLGKQFHQYVPHLGSSVGSLKSVPKLKDIVDYFSKIYPNTDKDTINELAESFLLKQKKKVYLAKQFPHIKLSEIDLLSDLVTDEDIKQYERDNGNE